jgi:hypothetical protein
VVVSFFSTLFFTAIASALDIKLAWNASYLADGYRLFCREQDDKYDYMRPHWEGSATQCTVFNLDDDATYYFVVRAYNDFGEIGNSNESRYPDIDDGGGGSGGGCLIATAANGSRKAK